MSFTPTEHVRTCRDCGRAFVVSRQAIEFAMQDAVVATEEEAVEEIDFCLECTTGELHPEERVLVTVSVPIEKAKRLLALIEWNNTMPEVAESLRDEIGSAQADLDEGRWPLKQGEGK